MKGGIRQIIITGMRKSESEQLSLKSNFAPVAGAREKEG
jgi:hypothetical protein